jgi:TonB family protein
MSDTPGSSKFGNLSEFWFHSKPILLIGFLILFSLYTNDAVIQYRMNEYNRAMETLSQTYNSSHALNMLARFDLIKKRQNMPEEDETALELKLQSLASSKLLVEEKQVVGLKSKVIGAVISGVGFILGKQRSKANVPTMITKNLEVAYFYERSRKYEKAIEIYTKGLEEKDLPPEVSATLLLHRGFCSSLMGEYQKAKADFDKTIALVPQTEESHVALKLKELTLGLEDQVKLAKESKQGSFQAGRQMFLLANYAEAAKSLRTILNNPASDSLQLIQSRYLYARSQEELGQDSDAVITYRSVIQQAPNSDEAKKANRRLYVLGKFYSNDEDLAKAALTKMEKYQDFKFINSLKSLDVPKPTQGRTPKADLSDALTTHSTEPGTGTSKLDKLDVGDLKGDKRANEKAKLDAGKAEAEKLTATLKRDVQARRANAKIIADPLRQQAIFATIEGNMGEMEFIYQKFMRKGTVFEGNLMVRILIDPTGRVKDARIVNEKSTIDHPSFCSEILQNAKKWRFREDPNASGDIPVSFPLRFVNKE